MDNELIAKLKGLRRELADKAKMPAYIIFSNAALVDMCRRMPMNEAEFLEVSGVGKKKMEMYGERFIEVIRKHKAEKG